MGIFDGWVVLVNDEGVVEVYTHKGYKAEQFEGLIELPFEDWCVETLAVIFGNVLEAHNCHSMADVPASLIDAMDCADVPKDMQADVMRRFAQNFNNF